MSTSKQMKPKQPPMNPFLEKYKNGYILNKKYQSNGKDPPKERRRPGPNEPKNPFLSITSRSLPDIPRPTPTPIPQDRRRANEPWNPFLSISNPSRPTPIPSARKQSYDLEQSQPAEPKNPFLSISSSYQVPLNSKPAAYPFASNSSNSNHTSPTGDSQSSSVQTWFWYEELDTASKIKPKLEDSSSQTVEKSRSVSHPLTFPIEAADGYLKKLILGLKEEDLDRLNENKLLNDVLIEVGLRYWLWDLSLRWPALGETVYTFNSFFYLQLKLSNVEESYSHVKRWTRKNKIDVDIFSKEFIVIPIHEQYHWYLAVIHRPYLILPYHLPSPTSPNPHNAARDVASQNASSDKTDVLRTTIYILDSMGAHHPEVGPRLSSYLKYEAREKHNCFNTSGTVERMVKVPQQPNSTDCGIYLLHFAETFVERYDSSLAEATTVHEDLWCTDILPIFRTRMKSILLACIEGLSR